MTWVEGQGPKPLDKESKTLRGARPRYGTNAKIESVFAVKVSISLNSSQLSTSLKIDRLLDGQFSALSNSSSSHPIKI